MMIIYYVGYIRKTAAVERDVKLNMYVFYKRWFTTVLV